MPHDHRHNDHGHGHAHGVSADADAKWLVIALVLNGAFMVAEVVAGIVANSLALLSDAAHMATDAGAIALALVAARLARRRPSGSMTFGLKRTEILSAQFNAATLLVLAAWIAFEGVRRLIDPSEVEGGIVLYLGALGLLVNLAAAWALAQANRTSLNVEGAFQHTLMDALSSVGAMVAAVFVLAFGFDRADPLISLLVAGLMVRSGWSLLVRSGRVLLEAAPEGIDPAQVGRTMAGHPGVAEVHDLHVWEVTSGFPALSAHVIVHPDRDCHDVRRALTRLLAERFGLDHSTLQVDHATNHETLVQIEPRPDQPSHARSRP